MQYFCVSNQQTFSAFLKFYTKYSIISKTMLTMKIRSYTIKPTDVASVPYLFYGDSLRNCGKNFLNDVESVPHWKGDRS